MDHWVKACLNTDTVVYTCSYTMSGAPALHNPVTLACMMTYSLRDDVL